MPASLKVPDPRHEAAALLRAQEGKLGPCLTVMMAQFAILQNRSQLLLTLCTLTLTITGFSGPRIIASGEVSRWAMVVGISLVLIGLVLVLLSSVVFHFATQYLAEDEPLDALAKLITYRNRKTGWYRWQLAVIVLGLAGYVIAVVHYLVVGELVPRG